jgi:hypothetical protein
MGSQVGGGQEGEDEETRQAKEQAAARRRWEALVIGEFPSRLPFSCAEGVAELETRRGVGIPGPASGTNL